MPFDDPVMAGKGVIVKIARSYVEACGAWYWVTYSSAKVGSGEHDTGLTDSSRKFKTS